MDGFVNAAEEVDRSISLSLASYGNKYTWIREACKWIEWTVCLVYF